MNTDLVAAIKAVVDRLAELAEKDDELRGRMRDVARVLLASTAEAVLASSFVRQAAAPAEAPPAPEATPEPTPTNAESAAVGPAPPPPPVKPSPPPLPPAVHRPRLAPVIQESYPPHDRETSFPASFDSITEDDLPLIEARCKLKAEAARWAAGREANGTHGIEPGHRELIDRARELSDCYLWMLRDEFAGTSATRWEQLAGCFEAVAAAAVLFRDLAAHAPDNSALFVRALELAAEAQSALRSAALAVGAKPDWDQVRLFIWVRESAGVRHVQIARHMRTADPAEPAVWPSLLERIEQAGRECRKGQEAVRKQRKLIDRVRHRAEQIAARPESAGAEHWPRLLEVVDELVGLGLPPSNRELRDRLLPVLDQLPAGLELPKNVRLVLREIDRYLESRAEEAGPSEAAEKTDPEVRRAAELLRGKALVLIGGEGRPHAKEALEDALGLSELIWLEGWHGSYMAFEPDVARPDVAVVVLAIRWSSHGFGEVKAFCDRYGKPLVRLPAGYNPKQVAHHVLAQAGGRLGDATYAPAVG